MSFPNLKYTAPVFFISFILLASCLKKGWKVYDPIFSISEQNISQRIKEITTSEKVNFSGKVYRKEYPLLRKTLQIEIINSGINFSNDAELKASGLLVVKTIKQSLVNSKQYSEYAVIFIETSSNFFWKQNRSKYFYYPSLM